MLKIQNSLFFNVDVELFYAPLGEFDVVADFALDADICDEALAGFGVDAGEIAGIGVAVGVGVGGIEELDVVVTVVHDGVVGWWGLDQTVSAMGEFSFLV